MRDEQEIRFTLRDYNAGKEMAQRALDLYDSLSEQLEELRREVAALRPPPPRLAYSGPSLFDVA